MVASNQNYQDIMLCKFKKTFPVLHWSILRGITTQSEYLNQMMKEIQIISEQRLITNLAHLHQNREFLSIGNLTQEFTNKIQNFFYKKGRLGDTSLQIYMLLRSMFLITPPFRKSFLELLHANLIHRSDLSNEAVESFLWLIHQESPFRQQLFESAAENHTLKLFDMHEYMNQLTEVPKWEPYIRVSTLLKLLGHSISVRRDLFQERATDKISYYYYPFVASLASGQKVKKHKDVVPFNLFLCEQFLLKDEINYDKYLYRIQQIDNLGVRDQINRTLDILSWADYKNFLKMLYGAYSMHGESEILTYRASELFRRLCQTSELQVEPAVCMLSVLCENKYFFRGHRTSLILRIMNSIVQHNNQELKYLPAKGMSRLLNLVERLDQSQLQKSLARSYLISNIRNLLIWEDDDPELLSRTITSLGIAIDNSLIKFLDKKKQLV